MNASTDQANVDANVEFGQAPIAREDGPVIGLGQRKARAITKRRPDMPCDGSEVGSDHSLADIERDDIDLELTQQQHHLRRRMAIVDGSRKTL